LLSGPLPAALRILSLLSENPRSLRKAAAVSAIAGSLLTRIAWIYAGHVSARDWTIPLGIGGDKKLLTAEDAENAENIR
jgi:hypothetical protein